MTVNSRCKWELAVSARQPESRDLFQRQLLRLFSHFMFARGTAQVGSEELGKATRSATVDQ